MDLIQLLGLILVLVAIKIVALTYHVSKMNAIENKVDQYLVKMDEYVTKMEKRLNMLENRMARCTSTQK